MTAPGAAGTAPGQGLPVHREIIDLNVSCWLLLHPIT